MKDELDKQLCETYPYMFQERNMPMSNTCMCWGFAHGDGWFNIINQLCSNIEHHVRWAREQRARALMFNRRLEKATALNDIAPLLPKNPTKWQIQDAEEALRKGQPRPVPNKVQRVVVEQVKEKFGTLRFYYRGGDEQVCGMVRMAEAMSGVTCEECGSPGTTGGQGWITTLCSQHREEANARYKERFGEN